MKCYRILEAANNSAKTRETKNRLEEITWAPGYAEPGYSCGPEGIYFGNWNEPDNYDSVMKDRVPVSDANILPRLGDCLEKNGAEVEWSDEWSTCSDCGKAMRTSPDSFWWKFAGVEKKGEYYCKECAGDETSD